MKTYRINCQHWLCALLVLAASTVCFTACSKEETEAAIDNSDKGKDNTTDMVVTGGIGASSIGEDDKVAVEASGYLNLPDDVKATLGLGVQLFGVEISTSQSFPENATSRTAGLRLEDNRKFTVTLGGLKENTLYYYRSFFGAGEIFVYGNTESFTSPSIAAALGALTTDDPRYVGNHSANIPVSGGARQIAYDIDASKLTAENIRQGKVAICDGSINDLESGTTYYYCAVRIIKDYVGMGEVKSFTTEGLNVKELAKSMTFNITYDETTTFQWKASFTSSLASKYPGSNIKYAIRAYLESNYPLTSDEDRFNITTYGGNDSKVYAEDNGSSYTAVTYPPMYVCAHYNDDLVDGVEFEEFAKLFPFWEGIRRHIYYGTASDDEKMVYEEIGGDRPFESDYHQSTYQYIHNYLDVIVEIDGKDYVVKKQEGKLRMIWDVDVTKSSSGRGGRAKVVTITR
ncbi:MAG: hypothetical protein IJQ44_07250 [Bacteroidaceae bacterium]|nr:hypothetical protein [Bacteroidaceae bacterium]